MKKMSLEELAAQQPQQDTEPPIMNQAVSPYRDQIQEREQAEELKDSILQQLKQSSAPEVTLYTAVQAIGVLTHDAEWEQAVEQALDAVYNSLAQQSFLMASANTMAAQARRAETQYMEREIRDLKRGLVKTERLKKTFQEALQAVERLNESRQNRPYKDLDLI